MSELVPLINMWWEACTDVLGDNTRGDSLYSRQTDGQTDRASGADILHQPDDQSQPPFSSIVAQWERSAESKKVATSSAEARHRSLISFRFWATETENICFFKLK